MAYKNSAKFVGDLTSIIGENFPAEDLTRALATFENLININSIDSDFNQSYGDFLNSSNISAFNWDYSTGNKWNSFKEKLDKVPPQPENFSPGDSLQKAYEEAKQKLESGLITETGVAAHFDRVKSLFTAYLYNCLLKQASIDDCYEKEVLSGKIDFVKYANAQIDKVAYIEKDFIQLEWFDDNKEAFDYSTKSAVKFIGEAGLGKTTQMKRLYFNLLNDVLKKGKKVIPVWVDLSDLSDTDETSIRNKVANELGEYGQYYELLLKNNSIALFFDGYNEVLSRDNQDILRRRLASDIDDIHGDYPSIMLAMTDRSKKSNPPCLMKDVKVFTCTGLTKDEVIAYVELKNGADAAAKIEEYLGSETSNWFTDSTIIPAKMNSIIDLFNSGIQPQGEEDFYEKYWDFILEREEIEKKETRIDDLKYLLYVLANEYFKSSGDSLPQMEITKIWKKELNGDLAEARRLFKLAVEMPILVPDETDSAYKFAYPAYFIKAGSGV